MDLPNDVLWVLIDLIWNTQTIDDSLISLSSTSSRFRVLVLPKLIDLPFFATPLSVQTFKDLFIPRYAHFVTSLFYLGWEKKLYRGRKQAALDILDACKGTLHTLSLVVPRTWKEDIVARLKEGGWGSLRCLRVRGKSQHKMDTDPEQRRAWLSLLGCVPHSVNCLVVDSLKLENLRTIGEHIHWLEEFQFLFDEEEEREWSEDEVRGEVKLFLDRNRLLKSVANFVLDEEKEVVFGLMDWIVLEECFLRGILKRRESPGRLSWDIFKELPESIPIHKAIMLLKQYIHFNSWKFNMSDINSSNPLSIQRIETYLLFVKEFGLKELTLEVVHWSSEFYFLNLMKLMDETGRNHHIQHLNLRVSRSVWHTNLSTYKGGFTKFLMGCVGLKRITVTCATLKVLRPCTLPPLSLTLHVSPKLPSLEKEDLKSLSTMSSLTFAVTFYPFIESFGYICQMLDNWKNFLIPIPNIIHIEYNVLENPNLTSLKQKLDYIKTYIPEHLKLWQLNNYQITVSFALEGFKITNSLQNQIIFF